MILNNSSSTIPSCFWIGIIICAVLNITILPGSSFAVDESISCPPPPRLYEAPPYVEPKPEPEISKLRLIDNKDGTITDLDTGLLWAQKDSFADLGKCLTWKQSFEYVRRLDTAKFTDWRIPTIKELATLYDPTKANIMAWDHNPEYPLALDEKFADGSAYWFWSSDSKDFEEEQGCAKTLYFVKGLIHLRGVGQCNNGGVRAVRNLNAP